jgi:fatty-acyl-CoA synthase
MVRVMHGLMQDRPLALPHVFHRAERGEDTVSYAEWAQRVRRLATVLDQLGLGP